MHFDHITEIGGDWMAAQRSPEKIVRKALKRDELALLLLGKPKYQYLPYWSPAPGNTCIVSLLSALRDLVRDYPKDYPCEEIRNRLNQAIKKIVNIYEGIDPVVTCLVFESRRRPFGLPMDEIAADLKQSIRVFSFRLEKDRTGEGAQYPDGQLGNFRRLSEVAESLGGPSFCD